jgi:hypothetical protein
MKNISFFVLLFFYIISSTGLTVNLHFCGGDLSNFSVFSTPKKCASCGKKNVAGCCKDLQVKLGNHESQLNNKITTFLSTSVWSAAELPNFSYSFRDLYALTRLDFSKQFTHKPLGKAHLPIYIEVCSYLI